MRSTRWRTGQPAEFFLLLILLLPAGARAQGEELLLNTEGGCWVPWDPAPQSMLAPCWMTSVKKHFSTEGIDGSLVLGADQGHLVLSCRNVCPHHTSDQLKLCVAISSTYCLTKCLFQGPILNFIFTGNSINSQYIQVQILNNVSLFIAVSMQSFIFRNFNIKITREQAFWWWRYW